MNQEKFDGKGEDPSTWEKILDEMHAPRINEISIKSVYDARRRFNRDKEEQGESYSQRIGNVKTLIKTEMKLEDPVIRGPVEIAEGIELTLAITPDQKDAFGIIYGIDLDSKVSYHASIKNAYEESKREEDVLIKYCDIAPASINNLIISKGLAEKLGIGQGQDVGILKVYQNTSKVNLDKL
jgi:hypothetical protein